MKKPRERKKTTTIKIAVLGGVCLLFETVTWADNYVILLGKHEVPSDLGETIAAAGGVLVNSFDPIGVAIARSANPDFGKALQRDARVEGACSTAMFGSQLSAVGVGLGSSGTASKTIFADSGDPLVTCQWDMIQIHVPQAHQITTGNHTVLVGDIDTGLDYTHPDLAPNVDFANSCSCIGGVPNQDPAAWMDDHWHGTHTAGTIAAAANGIGIVGVAPNVRIAAIKAGDANTLFFPEAVICAFMWAATHGFDVVNNSYFADPWLFNCRNDPGQHAIWKAEQRAIRFAISQGVTVVAAMGNENIDLAHPTFDQLSPDYPPGEAVLRAVNNACVVIPVEIPGVIGVTANGSLLQKTFYSNCGVGVTQVTAPGGDPLFQYVPDDSYGAVLSTIPKWASESESLRFPIQDPNNPDAYYAKAIGTSMATPLVTGVAALIIGRYGKLPPGKVQAIINQTADPLACPPDPFDPDGLGSFMAHCTGGAGYNSFYGHGQVNAFEAVAKRP